MKTSLIALIVSLGLAAGAAARPLENPSPSSSYHPPIPLAMPDWTLPSPCNLGTMVVLASNSDEEASPDFLTPAVTDGHELANYKCADNGPSTDPSRKPPSTLSRER